MLIEENNCVIVHVPNGMTDQFQPFFELSMRRPKHFLRVSLNLGLAATKSKKSINILMYYFEQASFVPI